MARAKGRRSNRRQQTAGIETIAGGARALSTASRRDPASAASTRGDLVGAPRCHRRVWWSDRRSVSVRRRREHSAQSHDRAIVAAVHAAASAVSRRGLRPSGRQLLAGHQSRDQPSSRRRANASCASPVRPGWISHCQYSHPLFEWTAAVRRHSPNGAHGSLCAMVIGAGYAGRGCNHRLARSSASDRSR